MKVLSIRQPFAWLISNGYQDVENRNRPIDYVGPVLIHAGKQMDPAYTNPADNARGALEFMLGTQRKQPWTMRHWYGENWEWPELPADDQFACGGIVGVAFITCCYGPKDRLASQWWAGPHAMTLRYALPLPFVPCPGERGLFDLSPAVMADLRKALRAPENAAYRERAEKLLRVNHPFAWEVVESWPPMATTLFDLLGAKWVGHDGAPMTLKEAEFHLQGAKANVPHIAPTWERIVREVASLETTNEEANPR